MLIMYNDRSLYNRGNADWIKHLTEFPAKSCHKKPWKSSQLNSIRQFPIGTEVRSASYTIPNLWIDIYQCYRKEPES